MAEVLSEFAKDQIYDTGLILRLELLVEFKLFNYQVVVRLESLLHHLNYVQIKVPWNENFAVR